MVDETNFNQNSTNESKILELLNADVEPTSFPNLGEEYSNPDIEEKSEQVHVSNDSLTFENLDNESNDILKDSESIINQDNSVENSSIDESTENSPQSYNKIHYSLPSFPRGETYYNQDSLLEKNIFDNYDPIRIKKNDSFKERSDDLKSSRILINPALILRNGKNEEPVLTKRVDDLLVSNGKTYKLFRSIENGSPSYLKEGESPVYLNSQPSSSPKDISPIPKLDEESSKGIEHIYDYYPKIQIGFGSVPQDGYGKDGKPNSDQKSVPEISGKTSEEIVIVKSAESDTAYPSSGKESGGTRKITIRKSKTMHSVSREEEESIVQKNPHLRKKKKNPRRRLSPNESTVTKPQPRSNDLPKQQENLEKREEVIVLVEGTDIPGQNYGPENDLLGYYKNKYDNLPPDSNHGINIKAEVVENSGPTSVSSNGINYNNHGDGISTQYFINNHPKSTRSFYFTDNEGKKQYNFPPTEIIPKVTHSVQTVATSDGDSNYNLPERHHKEQIYAENPQIVNKKHAYSQENIPETRNQDENQYVAIDPNQVYIDGDTGELIKFVYEDDGEKHETPQTKDQINEKSSYLQTDSGQLHHHGNLEDSNLPHGLENEGKSVNFEHNSGKIEYTHSGNAELYAPSPVTELVNSNHHGQLISETDAQYHAPPKDLEAKSNYHSVPFEGSHTTQENHNSDAYNNNGYNDDSKYVVLCPGHGNNQEDYENKLNVDSHSHSVSNSKSGSNQNHNNFKGSSDIPVDYGKTNDYHVPDKEHIATANGNYGNENYGSKLSSSKDFKGIGEGHYEEILYEPQVDEESLKNAHFPVLSNKGNGNNAKFPKKTDYVIKSHFSKGPYGGTDVKYPKTRKQNPVYFEFTKPQNNYKGGTGLKQNGSPGYNNVRSHENFRASLGNLYGYNSESFSSGKNQQLTNHITSNFQNSGYNKGNEVYISQKDLNELQIQNHLKGSGFGNPQNNFKGSLENYGGNNQNSGYKIQNTGSHIGVPSFGNPKGLAQHGGHKSNGFAYTNTQQNSNYKPENGYGGLRGIQQIEEPAEYIIVEADDDNYGIKGTSGEDSYLLQYDGNFKGTKNDFSYTNNGGGHSVLNGQGISYSTEHPNVRFVVDGGKDKNFHLKSATTGFRMDRGVLPLYPTPRPRSIKGNIQFGLQISKRAGPTKNSEYFIESRSDRGKSKKM
ncbi:uncharacterized protein NPIL_336031 [Nephila pilipes]|uniref:Uncharacterized protein n=1 Tax=Nephila pilipes TaxID=299642 RepID=A0A8X6P479_NEPPI|nr:uncharacterized protein NPIL_336031 [Nephila pilipes]